MRRPSRDVDSAERALRIHTLVRSNAGTFIDVPGELARIKREMHG
jgi:hypothetical protein